MVYDTARVTPARKYYPPHLNKQQDVTWNDKLTMTMKIRILLDNGSVNMASSIWLVKKTPNEKISWAIL